MGKNYNLLKKRKINENPKTRDVYENQQLERGFLPQKESKLPRKIGAGILAGMVGVGLYIVISLVMGFYKHMQTDDGSISNFKPDFTPSAGSIIISLVAGTITYLIAYMILMRNYHTQNSMAETTDINQYQGDTHVQLVEEMQKNYDIFPDWAATSSVVFSSMISHVMLNPKGLKQIKVTKRYKEDVKDKDGNIEHFKGEPVLDENDEPIMETKCIIDTKFGDDLFKSANVPKEFQIRYDATKVPYNPGNINRDKLKDCDTWADVINKDWEVPDYEFGQPAGVYIVDTAPVNTMVLAITRAGKGNVLTHVA